VVDSVKLLVTIFLYLTVAAYIGSRLESGDTLPTVTKIDGAQAKKSPPTTPAFKKRHRGCSYCILDLDNAPLPVFPLNEVVVGVITMEDVIEELLQVRCFSAFIISSLCSKLSSPVYLFSLFHPYYIHHLLSSADAQFAIQCSFPVFTQYG